MPSGKVWTDDKLAKLQELAASPEKPHVATLALAFGVSRNSIIGAAHRNGIVLPRLSNNPSPVVVNVNKKRRAARAKLEYKISASAFKPDAYELKCAAVDPLHITFADLEPCHCRFPYGDDAPFTYCGHPVKTDKPYCEAHSRLCFEPLRPAPEPKRIYIPNRSRAA